MKYITVKFTEDQASFLVDVLGYEDGYIQDNSMAKENITAYQAFIKRLQLKILKSLRKQD